MFIINKKAWDKEYATNFLQELRYLENNGITTYKFEKTSELFGLLSIFYKQNNND